MVPAERKRPVYVMLALLVALLLGTSAANGAWSVIETYREPIDPSLAGENLSDEADRAAVIARYEAYVHVLDAARPRGWPVAVGSLLLGTGVVIAAIRALGGGRTARALLLQLIVAQAALGAASYWLLGDVVDAENRWKEAELAARVHESSPSQQEPQQRAVTEEALRMSNQLIRIFPRVELVFGTLSSALVVIALTRRRARDFFDSSAEAFGGR
jgi:hypothetical protein